MRGFSLIEVLVTIGLFAGIGACVAVVTVRDYESTLHHADTEMFVMLLEHARAQAVLGVCDGVCDHDPYRGVFISSSSCTMFDGTSYQSRYAQYDALFECPPVAFSSAHEVVFSPRSATSSGAIFVLLDQRGTSTVTVHADGQILWTD